MIDEHGQVEQVNHYYAFGGLMGESTGGGAQPYKYNGRELDRMHGLDWYDYSARHYDAALGRWMCVDPLAEKYDNVGSYIYCKNNPIAFMDMNGKDGVAVIDYENHSIIIVGNKDFHGRSGDAAGEYNPANRIITLGEGAFTPNNKGQTLQHEIGHSWGLEHDHEMGISMPEKDLLGRELKEGGIMTSALKRSISPQEVSYGIGLILQAVPNNHSSKVTVNIHIDRNYEIQK